MHKKLAVAIIHGMGSQKEDFAKETIALINNLFAKKLEHLVEDPVSYLKIQAIHWAPIFTYREDKLFEKMVQNNKLNYLGLRKFLITYLGDAIAYQPVETVKQNYERVHEKVGEGLNILAKRAGDHAPLCVISHSLGSVIASNYFYDLQFKKSDLTCVVNESSPLEKGDTLTLFYTMGTTLPIWSLRYYNFNRPINIPSRNLKKYYPSLKGEWLNFYDKDDVLGFPLRPVDESYQNAVNEDREVNVGGLLTSWNPLSHTGYFKDMDVIEPIVDGLVRTWRQVNNI
ncbi:chemotaxis protein [Bacillus sp. DTU_2020_1000418_1_SI_GHA_SEK_038]|uniref:chemotaxis protein n=1 Tax=Bacillus sp. DTU_2020_1000418_1_SI_GHA_SEK_038 TaxID=3077585 RepID=UPI0028E772A1|nr:chemotaxis protein [Bacillus sp. DTU_2020_1000418_1_SI_GHA_SEK_038]WNS76550.1 chemotaxis protein [Bacillus sp. DTU_2020_1000418_1_SI_GHA_SEK_038]